MNLIRRLVFTAIIFLSLCLLFYICDNTNAAPGPGSDSDSSIIILHEGEYLTMSLESYLIGALAAEMPASFGEDALKAQTVAIRTYVLAGNRHGDAAVCTDSSCCLAWTDADADKAVIDAVSGTAGEYLMYENKPIQAVFHASSCGTTEDSAALWTPIPYLTSVETPETAQTVPTLVTTVVMTPEALAETLGFTDDTPPAGWLEDIRYGDTGRVKALLICGSAYTGAYVRQACGLRSTDFDIEWDGEAFVFTVTGHGHGVGMSQYGAKLLAEQGYTYEHILAHYYPGTTLVT